MRKLPEDWVKTLFGDRKIVVAGKIDGEAQELVSSAILTLNVTSREPIKLYIDSTGGELEPELYLSDIIKASSAPVHGIVTGLAHSASFGLLQACQVRKALPHSKLMFHAPGGNNLRIDAEDFADRVKKMTEIHEEQIREYAKRSGRPEADWREWSKRERQFRAPEALEHGIIDEIVSQI